MRKEHLLELLAGRLTEQYRERASILQDPHRGDLFRLFLQARRFDVELTEGEIRQAVAQRVENPAPALLGMLRDFAIMWSAWQYCGARADIGLDHLLTASVSDPRINRIL